MEPNNTSDRDPIDDLRQIAFLLERANEATYRVRAFRGAAEQLGLLDPGELNRLASTGELRHVKGVGEVTARCIVESLRGEEPVYLRRLRDTAAIDIDEATGALRAALRGDCHCHSDWSDGGAPIEEMVAAAVALGHSYLVLTDHSPSLKVARGLPPARLRKQLQVVTAINETLTANGVEFRLLTGMEVDILADGSLDQEPSLLAQLDVVVGSIHSGLKDDSDKMTRRMLAAIKNPYLDILGHCTGRKLPTSGGDRGHRSEKGRAESQFDADAIFDACARSGKAVEVNSRPDRLDPPKRLLRKAIEAGCLISIDSDAHAPGQLDWLHNGCERAVRCGVQADRVINTWPAARLLSWAAGHC